MRKNNKLDLKILFFCKYNDKMSYKILSNLKKKFKKVTTVYSNKHNESIKKKVEKWSGDFILCYRSYYILPSKIINLAKIASINFHPGPPEYRGIGCVNFAIYNNEKSYGVTAHLIDKKIDHGKILKVKRFDILKKKNLETVLKKTHLELFKLANFFIDKIYKNNLNLNSLVKKNSHIKWSRKITKRKQLEKLYTINKDISEKNLKKTIKATVYKNFQPYIYLHGQKFYLDEKK